MVIVTIGVLGLDIAGIQIPIKKVSIVEAVKVIFDHNSMKFLIDISKFLFLCKLLCTFINFKIGVIESIATSCSSCKCKSGQYIVDEYGNCNYWCSKSGYC